MRRLVTAIVAAASLVLLLASCALPFAGERVAVQRVIVGEDQLSAQVADLRGTPEVPPAQAVTIAERYAPAWQQASSVTTRYVTLTLRSSDGKVAWGVQGRTVWLVSFKGARYAPEGYPESKCACDRQFQPPNTAVAVDARTGALVIDYGFEG